MAAAEGRMPEGEGKRKEAEKMDARKDGVAREVIRMEREAVIPILKPKLFMRLAYLIGCRRFSRFLFTFCCGSLAVA